MLGFGKKKDKDTDKDKNTQPEDDKDKKKSSEKQIKDKTEKETKDKTQKDKPPKDKKSKTRGKKRIPVKLILIVFFILCVGVGGFVVYSIYFSAGTDLNHKPAYKKISLVHINLPEEILEFSFNYFPELYAEMIIANNEILLIDKEIGRIDAVSKKYPDQAKIAEKEKKIWEKTKDTLQKAFIKIEKPVKETYVLFQVNEPDGLAKIEELKSVLTQTAQTALVPAQELTKRLKSSEVAPEGFIQGYIYQFKKKFL